VTDVVISHDRDGRVGEIVLNRPDKANALTPAIAVAITEALDAFDRDARVRLVVVRATGDRAFCGGYDLSGVSRGVRDDELQIMLRRLRTMAVPSVAIVHGHAVGAGLDLACSCDLRIVQRGVRIGLPAVRLGVAYDAEGLQRILSVAPGARRLLLSGLLAPAEAVAGFADVVADDGLQLDIQVAELVEAMTSASPAALAYMVAMTRSDASRRDDRASARIWRDEVLDGPDVDIALEARTGGHPPVFGDRVRRG
jgi:enoyl-CoA hydratase/carnithine racemase